MGIRDGSILIENGRIIKIGNEFSGKTDAKIDAKGLLALPGLIDAHVHLRDTQLSDKEDFQSGTSAAAAGGFTSILDMPNSKPPVDSASRLKERMTIASKRILVNVGFHAALVRKKAQAKTMANLGAFSFKLYMPRPISELDVENDQELVQVLRNAKFCKIPVTVHAEEPSMIGNPSGARTFLDLSRTHPARSESLAITRILAINKVAKCNVHFTHLTLPSSLVEVQGQRSGKITSEVTPHHLLLSENRLRQLGWKAWMIPPLRSRDASHGLLSATLKGAATIIASDHAPHRVQEKARLEDSPPGVPGLETTLPLLLTLVKKGRLSLRRMVSLLAVNPARLFRMSSKGHIRKGADGDIVLVDLEKGSKIDPERFLTKAKYSPFEGFETRGAVEKTIVGGRLVFDQGQIVAPPGTGEVLRRAR
jgi:dihydroorotase